jgi:Domain of unknown function (DUF4189)
MVISGVKAAIAAGAVFAMALGSHVTAPTANALGTWGSIAISPSTALIGYGVNMATPGNAENLARALCEATDCQPVLTFTNACGAVAQSPLNLTWGWAWNDYAMAAQSLAVVGCEQAGGVGCLVIGWTCSGY